MTSAGLIYGPELHHLDHLAPLCAILDIPLIVTEQKIATLAKQFYPQLQVLLWDYLVVAQQLVADFDIVFYSTPRDLFDEIFFFAQKLLQKKVHTIWCPHGNSDKGNSIFYMEALKKEEAALVYGKQMIEFFQRKKVWEQLKGHVITGNFRHAFYLKNREYYDGLAQSEVGRKLPPAEKRLLYAPTWKDDEGSCSFFEAIQPLVETLPQKYNLLVKLHPNLLLQEEFKVGDIVEKYESEKVVFLKDFPAIYPLLNLADAYIGDMSSVGYDFLTFNRPMFFFNPNGRNKDEDAGLYLLRCGIEILPEKYGDIHKIIQNYFQLELRNFSEIREDVYTYAFGKDKSLEKVKEEIVHLCSIFKNELPFY